MDTKSAILIIIIVVLVGAAGYLTFLLSDGTNPLILFTSQASDEDLLVDDPLLDDEDPLLAQTEEGPTPSPTISYMSTSPTPTPTTGLTVLSPSPSPLISEDPEPSELPETGGLLTATPTPVTELPTAGITDYLPAVFGGVLLIFVAMLL